MSVTQETCKLKCGVACKADVSYSGTLSNLELRIGNLQRSLNDGAYAELHGRMRNALTRLEMQQRKVKANLERAKIRESCTR